MTNEVKNITLEAFFLLHVDHLIKNHTGVDDKNAMINQDDGEWFETEWVVSEISSNTTKPMFDYDMSVRVVMLSVLLGVIIILVIISIIITIIIVSIIMIIITIIVVLLLFIIVFFSHSEVCYSPPGMEMERYNIF